MIKLTENEIKLTQLLIKVKNEIFSKLNILLEIRIAGGWVRDKILLESATLNQMNTANCISTSTTLNSLGLKNMNTMNNINKNTLNDLDICIDKMSGLSFCLYLKNYLNNNEIHQKMTIGKIKENPLKSKHLETCTTSLFGLDLDFTCLRSEIYSDTRTPTIAPATVYEDCFRRDITINSLYFNISTLQVEDHTGLGLLDLKNGLIRTPLDPLKTFNDDPLRILRVIRFATRFNFAIDSQILKAVCDPSLKNIFMTKLSRERVGIEVEKMLKGKDPFRAIDLICEFGFYDLVFGPLNDQPGACAVVVDADSGKKLKVETENRALHAASLLKRYCT
jgi:tRNA nucleotidyltransferase/poly(A) polymerase